jgi:hypothetical protein
MQLRIKGETNETFSRREGKHFKLALYFAYNRCINFLFYAQEI